MFREREYHTGVSAIELGRLLCGANVTISGLAEASGVSKKTISELVNFRCESEFICLDTADHLITACNRLGLLNFHVDFYLTVIPSGQPASARQMAADEWYVHYGDNSPDKTWLKERIDQLRQLRKVVLGQARVA